MFSILPAFRVQLPHSYVRNDTIRLFYSRIFVAVLMLLLLHIFLSLAIADVARFIRVRISSVESRSEERIDQRYVDDVKSSRRSPFINIVVIALLCTYFHSVNTRSPFQCCCKLL